MVRGKQEIKLRRVITALLVVLGIALSIFTEHAFAEEDDSSIQQTYEAEDAEAEGTIVDNKHPGFTGDGFRDYNPNVPGGYIEWTVNLPQEKDYYLVFRYAHAGGSERPAEVRVNGEKMEELPFPPTGDWATWNYQTIHAPLQEGENVIRLTATGAEGGGNIDHLRIQDHPEEGGPEEVETEKAPLAEVIDGVTMKKLYQLGVLADVDNKQSQAVTFNQFLALINNAFGFDIHEKYKNIELKQDIGRIPADTWGIYAARVAKDQNYVPDFLWDQLKADQPLSKKKLALIVGDLLDMVPEEEEGPNMLGKLAKQGIMNPNSENNHGIKDDMTWQEARKLAQTLTKVSDKDTGEVHIARIDALTQNLISVTLNGTFDEFDLDDLKITAAKGNWDSLSPFLNRDLRISKAAMGTDIYGNTVLFLRSLDELEGGKFLLEEEPEEFTGDVEEAIERANNIITWQMDHGGWSKGIEHNRSWDGEEPRSEWVNADGVELGTIDNDATVKEIYFLAEAYYATKDERYKKSAEEGIDFLMDLQYDTGGFAQVFPRRGNYSDMVTFNDEAMIRVLDMFDDILNQKYPFNTGVIDETYHQKLEESMKIAVDYILKAQVEVDGKLTAWGAQHDPYSYEPVKARAYEHPSISGKESVGIVRFLMSRPNQTYEMRNAIKGALDWFDKNKLVGVRYVSGGDEKGEYFVEDPNTTTWYRFYEIGTNKPIFSGRDGIIKHDIHEIEQERRDGYQWGGSYATLLLKTAKTTGYFENHVYAQVVNNGSKDKLGRSLVEDEVERVEDYSKLLNEIESKLVVDKDGNGDYETVQEAIDAVPENNEQEVKIFINNGVYHEVIDIPANKPYISLIGEDEQDTRITYDNYAGKDNGIGGKIGTFASATAFLRADHGKVENLTIENSFDESIGVKDQQAVAVNATGDKLIFNNVRFLGNQDTLLANAGRQYYYNSYIEGDVDFIFGAAQAVFENCTIHSLDRGSESNNGYITAASTLVDKPYGFLFVNNDLTSDAPEDTVYLGRPWQPSSNPTAIASVVFRDSTLGEHIKQEGWTEMGGFQPQSARLYEYNNAGPGAVVNQDRHQLSDEEAEEYTVENVLDGWVPEVN
ncbi:pectate lyase, PelA/Pel-15E family [Halobacillus dabanensis]|uniref:Pectate lyase, PelA/Pel-15E family n=1 Tax=Halobacillus dabanensis TaxID=240302 RepID=A0A1I3V2L7_HALDA|nr:pectate lyase [Halobacillus dabanensis]SFJ89380.1 pectate lyase, PelA/Pel-15E family [Halobacillus dabanensis]